MLLKTILKKSKIFCQVKDMFLKTSFLIISSNSSNFFFTNEFLIRLIFLPNMLFPENPRGL